LWGRSEPWRRLRAQTQWYALASANPVSLCVPTACEEGKQPTKEGHKRGTLYNELRDQRILGYSTVAMHRGADTLDHAGLNQSISLSLSTDCENDMQPTREKDEREALFHEQLSSVTDLDSRCMSHGSGL
uniref:Teneurin N-terminal domain-containing protein n=1 Tax=Mesocestoides corti TaxID=53468 RepID=A0A5K3FKZ2_MESCO